MFIESLKFEVFTQWIMRAPTDFLAPEDAGGRKPLGQILSVPLT